jgi:hypothetical protein
MFFHMFRSYRTIIMLFYMYINLSFSTIPPYTYQCLHLEVRCYLPLRWNWIIKIIQVKTAKIIKIIEKIFVHSYCL